MNYQEKLELINSLKFIDTRSGEDGYAVVHVDQKLMEVLSKIGVSIESVLENNINRLLEAQVNDMNPLYLYEGRRIDSMIEAHISAFHHYLKDTTHFFKSRCSQLLRVCIKALKLAYRNNCSFQELNEIIQPSISERRIEVLAILKAKSMLNEVMLLKEYHKNLEVGGKMKDFTLQTYRLLHNYMLELISSPQLQDLCYGPATTNILPIAFKECGAQWWNGVEFFRNEFTVQYTPEGYIETLLYEGKVIQKRYERTATGYCGLNLAWIDEKDLPMEVRECLFARNDSDIMSVL
ncbi:hypothetical protein ABE82_26580 (plasmid) [Paenibacillus peoriae]|uniref:hypothetical protein n=1 Tax=Paenibacillus peoriae TaxID=59893 RepID=UPI00071EA5C7|nr:hypothetical protein [Paenibacillus peoriae]ALS09979.1 hypothetical protein ABE82_26580 [Paenibacillus peoriae]